MTNPTHPSSAPATSSVQAEGEAHYRAGRYTEASAIFKSLCDAEPNNADANRLLGLCKIRLGDVPAALERLEQARALAPSDPYAQLHYGLGLHAAGRNAEAAREFRASAAALPDDPAPYLNLSAALLALGDNQGALDAARRARRRGPKLPQAIYMVGLALLALDRLEEAEEEFAQVVTLAPGLADGWVNLGIVRYRRDDIERAKVAMRKALDVDPSHMGAAANLGAFLRMTGNVELSEKWLADVLARNPAATEIRLARVSEMLQEDKAAEALALMDEQPAPTEPRLLLHWNLQRALALLLVGRTDEARAIIDGTSEVPPALAPSMLWRRVLLAVADRDSESAQKLADEMERALATIPGVIPEHRIMGHFDLARFWQRQHRPERTFHHYSEGHRLLRRFQPFSRDEHRAFIDASIAQFDRVRLHEGPRAQNVDPSPVFIVGMPRSGTTLAEQIIGAHAQAFGAGERAALSRAFGALGGQDTPDAVARIAALGEPALDRAAKHYLAQLHALAPEATRIVDKMPGNFLYLGLAALMLPGARFIHCVRDPRDIGLSIFTFRFFGHHPYAHDLGDLGFYISEHDRLTAHWRAALLTPILTLALEDWVKDFDGTLHRVLDFLDLPYDSNCEKFYEQESRVRTVSRNQVRQPINARGLGRWRQYERELQPLIAELPNLRQ
jgi:tetratricopeptide (TPR) repeat protein